MACVINRQSQRCPQPPKSEQIRRNWLAADNLARSHLLVRNRRSTLVPTITIVAAAAIVELLMGRVPWCTCGSIKLWHGVVQSSENSQHISDWYTFSHVIHGIGFYALLTVIRRWVSREHRFVLAVLLESAWEVFENTPFVIDRYRAATISLDYYGDSVVNSVCDIGAMMFGFWLAGRLPWWVSLTLVIVMELGVGYAIRDNLTLNILMLLHPSEAVRRWQMGGS